MMVIVIFYQTYFYLRLRDHEGSFCFENVENWNKNVNVFSFQKLFGPLHIHGDHWALSVIDTINKRICYVDSMKSNDDALRG